MLQIKTLNVKAVDDAQKQTVARDAKFRSAINKQNYTTQQKSEALKVQDLLDYAYYYNKIYITYRKNFIAVKVEDAVVKNKVFLAQVFELFEENNYKVVQTQQGIIVRIAKH